MSTLLNDLAAEVRTSAEKVRELRTEEVRHMALKTAIDNGHLLRPNPHMDKAEEAWRALRSRHDSWMVRTGTTMMDLWNKFTRLPLPTMRG